MTILEANKRLLFQLYQLYDRREAENIADLVMEHLTGWRRIDRILNNKMRISGEWENSLDRYVEELNRGRPVQYVLQEAWFCGMKLYVDENVLIPRPETEELVEWVVSENRDKELSILDIGTGSGCIAIALQKKMPGAKIYACDVSEGAISVARRNSYANDTDIFFFQADILKREVRNSLPDVDIIVSNPPYIPFSEKKTMNENVVAHEPHTALFVSDDDPLIFYRCMAEIKWKEIYVEVHEELAGKVGALFVSPEIRMDMQGKHRMIHSRLH